MDNEKLKDAAELIWQTVHDMKDQKDYRDFKTIQRALMLVYEAAVAEALRQAVTQNFVGVSTVHPENNYQPQVQMTYTPAPWRAIGEFICTDEDDPQTIAHLSDHRNLQARTEEEDAANAQLIAAAPELLEALKALVEQFEKVDPLYDTDQRRINKAKEVIAKARGEDVQ